MTKSKLIRKELNHLTTLTFSTDFSMKTYDRIIKKVEDLKGRFFLNDQYQISYDFNEVSALILEIKTDVFESGISDTEYKLYVKALENVFNLLDK